jgi:alanyl-tRNA synthetase
MPTTDRLYYHDSYLFDFEAQVAECIPRDGNFGIVLDRTAFYPTSGGQLHDTGHLVVTEGNQKVAVLDVTDLDDGRVVHVTQSALGQGARVRGQIDATRRIDHIQQHTGQHVLSAAFIQLFNMATVSFHMGAESCTIDLDSQSVTAEQMQRAERLANEVIAQNRPVAVRFVPLEEARELGLRKLPPKQTGDLRLIDIKDFDLCACGGTHVRATGQIGCILLRKAEKVKQGTRVEFVCGLRAITMARKDYSTLTEAAALYSSHIHELPQQIRKSLEEAKSAAKAQHKLLEELAELQGEKSLAAVAGSPRVVISVFPERDAVFIKLLAQKLTAGKSDVVALLASGSEQTTLIFAQSAGLKSNMGQLLKQTLAERGGRGGGSAELAQGGMPGSQDAATLKALLDHAARRL